MDWRDTTSREAQNDLDLLLEDSVSAAADMLGRNGGFVPFMLVIGVAGDRAMRRSSWPGGSLTESEVRGRLELPGDADELRARAMVFDIDAVAPTPGDAIKVALEHRQGVSIDMVVPYRLGDATLDVDMDRADAAAAERRLWRERAGSAE